ncbi:hypothetical protein HDU85_007524 [Gaertneriomyces sp. JEL0708]|nr:hypothetical protein HDU85_007524 [Gaertneriomyces sp. JEL0708]
MSSESEDEHDTIQPEGAEVTDTDALAETLATNDQHAQDEDTSSPSIGIEKEDSEAADSEDDMPPEDPEDPEEVKPETQETATDILGSIVHGDQSTSSAVPDIATENLLGPEGNEFDDNEEGEESADAEDIRSTLQFLSSQPSQDPTLQRLHAAYAQLHTLFTTTRANEKALLRKAKQLQSELQSNATKVQAALKLSQEDRSTILSLRKEVKKAWKMVEVARDDGNRLKGVVDGLRREVEILRKEGASAPAEGLPATAIPPQTTREHLISMQIAQEDQIRRLVQQNESLKSQYEVASDEIRRLTGDVQELDGQKERLLTERASLDHEVLILKDLLASKKSEVDREIRAREKIEQGLKSEKESSGKKDEMISQKSGELKALQQQIAKLETTMKENSAKHSQTISEKDHVTARMSRLQQEYDEQVLTTTKLLSENQVLTGEIKGWEEECGRAREELRSVGRVRDALQKKVKQLEESRLEADIDREKLKAHSHAQTHDLDVLRQTIASLNSQIATLTRDRDLAQKNFILSTGAAQKNMTTLKLADQTKRTLEQEIKGYKDEAAKMRKVIYSLEKERERWIEEGSRMKEEVAKREEEVKLGEMTMFDQRKKISELERKLKEQQSLYENVRADRNVYSKNLVEAQDEITETKRKLKIMSHQIEQLKEEIASKEAALVKEHFEHSKLEKEKEALSATIGKLQQQYEDVQETLRNQQSEESKLRHIITVSDTNLLRLQKDYATLLQERDILGTQLIRRNDELSLLYEKIKIQTSTLHKGELQYRERLEDIRVCKLEIRKLRREKAILQTETRNVDGYRSEIFRLQRDLLRERTRVRVLEEELASPLNIHRWRKLSGSDPTTYGLITKVHNLQKRLIAKTEQCVEKELVIQQKEKLYKEMKEVVQRQPGVEVLEELRVLREACRAKGREAKALASELNMYHSQINEYKYEIERLNRDLQDLKRKYYESRKKNLNSQKSHRVQTSSAESSYTYSVADGLKRADGIQPHPPPGPRFSGGGFNMSSGPHQLAHYPPPSEDVQTKGEVMAV